MSWSWILLEDLAIFSDVLGTGAKFAIFLHRNQAAAAPHVTFQPPPAAWSSPSLSCHRENHPFSSCNFMLLKKLNELELKQLHNY